MNRVESKYINFAVVLVLIFLSVQFPEITRARCVPPKESNCPQNCSCHGNSIECPAKKLTRVPDRISSDTVKMYLTGNLISTIRKTDFAGCVKLKHLRLTANIITDIENGAFEGCRSLETLYLTSCKLHFNHLPDGVFQGLEGLKHLYINKNKWQETYNGILFENLTNLSRLEMDGIPDVDFPVEFSNLVRLHDLVIYNGLTSVSNSTFTAFSSTGLEMLTIKAAHSLRSLEPLSFSHFRKLKTLDLSSHRLLGLHNASVAFYGLRYTPVSAVFLNNVEPSDGNNIRLDADFFRLLNDTNVATLNIADNNINRMHPESLSPVPNLRHLLLNHNRLSKVVQTLTELSPIENLETIDLSKQLCETAGDTMYGAAPVSSGEDVQTELDKEPLRCATHNRVQCNRTSDIFSRSSIVSAVCLSLPANLKKLLLAESLKLDNHALPPIIIQSGGHSLEYLRLCENSIITVNGPIIFAQPVVNLTLDFSHNQITCFAEGLFAKSATNGSRIRELLLYNNKLSTQLEKNKNGDLFKHFNSLEELNLGRNGIKHLNQNAFRYLRDLKRLVLGENSLRDITFEFRHLKNLQRLDLSENLLATLENGVQTKLSDFFQTNKAVKVELDGNPFLCTCDTLPFIRWLAANRRRIGELKNTTCFLKDKYVNFVKINKTILPELEFHCSKNLMVVVASSLFPAALVILAVSICCFRHRWEIRYAFLKLTQRGRRYRELVEVPPDYEYDAFVVYDWEDRKWVNDELLPHLEDPGEQHEEINVGERRLLLDDELMGGLRLCVHERDFPPGEEIIGNIWTKMERSRKVLLVISRNFMTSDYCQYEMNLARMQSVETARNVIVPVLLDMPDIQNVSSLLNWIMRKLTYIEWPRVDETGDDRAQFWAKLRESLQGNAGDHLFQRDKI